MRQLSLFDTGRCSLCLDTGHWEGEPAPCPECGAYTYVRPKEDFPSIRYVDKHRGPNRKDRRSRKHRRG